MQTQTCSQYINNPYSFINQILILSSKILSDETLASGQPGTFPLPDSLRGGLFIAAVSKKSGNMTRAMRQSSMLYDLDSSCELKESSVSELKEQLRPAELYFQVYLWKKVRVWNTCPLSFWAIESQCLINEGLLNQEGLNENVSELFLVF